MLQGFIIFPWCSQYSHHHAHRFKVVIVHRCQTLSHLSPFGLKTRIERLLPDVKKQPLGITENVSVASSVVDRCSSLSEELMIILHVAQVTGQGCKEVSTLLIIFLCHFILKSRNNDNELCYGSWSYSQLSFKIFFKYSLDAIISS